MPELLLLLLFRLREGIVSVEALMLSSSVALLSVALPSNPRDSEHREPALDGSSYRTSRRSYLEDRAYCLYRLIGGGAVSRTRDRREIGLAQP